MNSPHWPAKFILNTLPPRNNGHRPRLLSGDLSGETQQKLALTDRWKCETGTGSLGTARRDPGRTDAFKCELCSHFIQRRPLDSYCWDKTKGTSRVSASVLNLYQFTDEMIFPLAGLEETFAYSFVSSLFKRCIVRCWFFQRHVNMKFSWIWNVDLKVKRCNVNAVSNSVIWKRCLDVPHGGEALQCLLLFYLFLVKYLFLSVKLSGFYFI